METLFWMCAFLLFYIYMGYPLVVWAAARICPKPVTRKPFAGRFAVVISAYNEQERIVATIGAIASHVSDL